MIFFVWFEILVFAFLVMCVSGVVVSITSLRFDSLHSLNELYLFCYFDLSFLSKLSASKGEELFSYAFRMFAFRLPLLAVIELCRDATNYIFCYFDLSSLSKRSASKGEELFSYAFRMFTFRLPSVAQRALPRCNELYFFASLC